MVDLTEYVDLETMKSYVGDVLDGVTVPMDDTLLQSAIDSASREVDRRAKRYFGKFEDATEREFTCYGDGLLLVDDFYTTDGLLIDGVALDTDTQKLIPRNGVKDGIPGWPYEQIKSCEFIKGEEYTITAKWGWEDVPATVIELTKMIASETYFIRETPLGVKGENQFGAIRVREKYHVEKKMELYKRDKLRMV